MAIVGAFARVEVSDRDETTARLGTIDGVTTFPLYEREKLGLLIEAPDVDAAHGLITGVIKRTPGVLGAWPVYCNTEDEQAVTDVSGC